MSLVAVTIDNTIGSERYGKYLNIQSIHLRTLVMLASDKRFSFLVGGRFIRVMLFIVELELASSDET